MNEKITNGNESNTGNPSPWESLIAPEEFKNILEVRSGKPVSEPETQAKPLESGNDDFFKFMADRMKEEADKPDVKELAETPTEKTDIVSAETPKMETYLPSPEEIVNVWETREGGKPAQEPEASSTKPLESGNDDFFKFMADRMKEEADKPEETVKESAEAEANIQGEQDEPSSSIPESKEMPDLEEKELKKTTIAEVEKLDLTEATASKLKAELAQIDEDEQRDYDNPYKINHKHSREEYEQFRKKAVEKAIEKEATTAKHADAIFPSILPDVDMFNTGATGQTSENAMENTMPSESELDSIGAKLDKLGKDVEEFSAQAEELNKKIAESSNDENIKAESKDDPEVDPARKAKLEKLYQMAISPTEELDEYERKAINDMRREQGYEWREESHKREATGDIWWNIFISSDRLQDPKTDRLEELYEMAKLSEAEQKIVESTKKWYKETKQDHPEASEEYLHDTMISDMDYLLKKEKSEPETNPYEKPTEKSLAEELEKLSIEELEARRAALVAKLNQQPVEAAPTQDPNDHELDHEEEQVGNSGDRLTDDPESEQQARRTSELVSAIVNVPSRIYGGEEGVKILTGTEKISRARYAKWWNSLTEKTRANVRGVAERLNANGNPKRGRAVRRWILNQKQPH